MELYAIYKDNKIFKASYEQNTPFYETEKGAQAGIKSQVHRKTILYNTNLPNNFTEKDVQNCIENEKKRYKIVRFTLKEEKN